MINYAMKVYASLLQEQGLLKECQLYGQEEMVVSTLTYDSNLVKEDTLFICKGAAFKEQYLQDAVKKGAVCYISETRYALEEEVPYLLVTDIRKAMPFIADKFYNSAWEDLTVIGIGGTKGKSTSAYYMKAIVDDYMEANGKKESAIISSIDIYDGITTTESHITTPEAVELQGYFRNAVNSGIEFAEMEVSSQALKYHRVDQMRFDVAVFLNVSEDHISPIEHVDFEDYITSKLRMFEKTKVAIYNMDCDYAERVAEAAKAAEKVYTISTKNKNADFYASKIHKEENETIFCVSCEQFEQEFKLTMPGLFNVENALGVIAAATVLEIPVEYMYTGLYRARSSGRMELYASKDQKVISIVDYAHNKLSFEKLFASTMEEYPEYDIIPVFGCPGKKAFIRRRDLGTIAGKYSKKVYLTAEDPGYEPVEDISKEIAQYVKAQDCPYEMIEDRGEAIKAAIDDAEDKTIILITGKGNETRQKYGCEYVDCPSDVNYVKKYLEEYDRTHF